MARRIDWTVVRSNQAKLTGQVFADDDDPLSLTGLTLSLVLKASSTATDGSGITFTPTITSSENGQWSQNIPGADLATAGTMWYRLDVIDGGGNPTTVNYGFVNILAA